MNVYEITLEKVEVRSITAGPVAGSHSFEVVGQVPVPGSSPSVGAKVVVPVVSVETLRELGDRFGRASKLRIILEE